MRPSVGSSNPPIIRSVVVLPHPDGPSKAKNDRAGSRRDPVHRDRVVEPLDDAFQTDVRSRGVRIRHASFTHTCLIRVYSSIE